MALEKELKVLDFVLWLNYYYFVLLDCFPLFLHFLTSLIKFALCNSWKAEEAKTFYKQELGDLRWGEVVCPQKGPAGSCLVSV